MVSLRQFKKNIRLIGYNSKNEENKEIYES